MCIKARIAKSINTKDQIIPCTAVSNCLKQKLLFFRNPANQSVRDHPDTLTSGGKNTNLRLKCEDMLRNYEKFF